MRGVGNVPVSAQVGASRRSDRAPCQGRGRWGQLRFSGSRQYTVDGGLDVESGGGRSRRAWFLQPDEELDVARGTGSGGDGEAGDDQAQRLGHLDGFVEDAPVNPAIADDATLADIVFTGLELGLDERDDLALRLQEAQRRGQHEGQANKTGVDNGEIGQFASR